MLAEASPLGVKPTRRNASGKCGKEGIERTFTLVHEMEQSEGVAPSPSFAVEVGVGGGESSELGQIDTRENAELGARKKRKMKATVKEDKRGRMRMRSEGPEDKNGDERATSTGTLRTMGAETSRLWDTALPIAQGKEMHPQAEDQTEEREGEVSIEHIEHVEEKTTHAQSMPSVTVRGKFCGLRPLMQRHVTEKVDLPAEDDSWSIQSDRGMDTEREIEDTEDELVEQKVKESETTTSGGNLQERNRDDEYILSWNEYTVDNIFADQNAQLEAITDNHASSPNPSLYTNIRKDSGVSLGGHCIDPQLPYIAPHPALLLRGGEASTVLMPRPAYPSEQLQFGLNDQYKERELYKTLGENLGRFMQEPRKSAKQAAEEISLQDIQGQKEGQLKSGDVESVESELEAQLDLQLGAVDRKIPEEKEYPVLHFVVPSPFGGGGARDEWNGEDEAEGDWRSSASNETVEIPEPGSGQRNGMGWGGEEWPGWDEKDSPVWVEQDWGKWVGGIRGPYGQEGL